MIHQEGCCAPRSIFTASCLLFVLFLSSGLWAEEASRSIALFNGRDLTGWEGAEGWWKVEDGAITSESTPDKPCRKANYLVWTGGQPGDFQLDCDFRISDLGNSGIHIRSERRPNHDMFGYQVDMTGDGKLIGYIYHHQRGLVAERGQQVLISPLGERLATRGGKRNTEPYPTAEELLTHYKPGEWNHYRILCRGTSIAVTLNGVSMCLIEDNDPKTAVTKGFIGLQMHPGPPMKIQFKNILLTPLPGQQGNFLNQETPKP